MEKCPIPVKGREYGLQKRPEKKRYLGMQQGAIVYHHECEYHKFHIVCSGDGKTSWKEGIVQRHRTFVSQYLSQEPILT